MEGSAWGLRLSHGMEPRPCPMHSTPWSPEQGCALSTVLGDLPPCLCWTAGFVPAQHSSACGTGSVGRPVQKGPRSVGLLRLPGDTGPMPGSPGLCPRHVPSTAPPVSSTATASMGLGRVSHSAPLAPPALTRSAAAPRLLSRSAPGRPHGTLHPRDAAQ